MSAEPLKLSREKKRAFRAGQFPDIITKDMIREMSCTIDCAPGTPNYKDFKVTEGMLFTKVPVDMSPPLEYCDHLTKINGIAITTKKQMQEAFYRLAKMNKPHYLVVTFNRVISVERLDERSIPANAAIRKKGSSDKSVKPNVGYMYYKLVLIYFPRSKLGINVKSYQNVVYVESTDNTWGSTTRRFLYLGDAILRIDDTEILDLPTTQNALRTGFSKNGVVTIIVERAVHQESYAFVRSVMVFSKVLDPMLPQDVIQTCTARLAYHNKHGFAEPTPIFKGYTKDYSSAGRVSVTNTVEIKSIRTEQLNPEILQNVPDFSNPENK